MKITENCVQYLGANWASNVVTGHFKYNHAPFRVMDSRGVIHSTNQRAINARWGRERPNQLLEEVKKLV